MHHRLAIHAAAILSALLLAGAPLTASAEPATGVQSSGVPKLFVATNGVALSQFPSASRLSATVKIESTRPGAPPPWTARSDSAWLTATPSGGTLALQADPTGLTADTLYTANVVVAATSPAAARSSERIRVSFWKGSADPGIVEVPETVGSLVTNPVEPLAYVGDGGQSIRLYDVYSGALVRTLEKVAPSLGALVVSSDGTKLLTVDTTNFKLLVLDARTGRPLQRIRIPGPIAYDFTFAYARPGGHETIYAAGLPAIDLASGQSVSAPIQTPAGFFSSPLIKASADGTRLAVLERGNGWLDAFDVQASDGQLTVSSLYYQVPVDNGFFCQSMAMTADGSRLYTACGSFEGIDSGTGTPVQVLPVFGANNAVFDSKGQLVGGVGMGTNDVFVFNRQGYTIGQVPASSATSQSGQATGPFATSGDSTRVISATDPAFSFNGQMLVFRSLP